MFFHGLPSFLHLYFVPLSIHLGPQIEQKPHVLSETMHVYYLDLQIILQNSLHYSKYTTPKFRANTSIENYRRHERIPVNIHFDFVINLRYLGPSWWLTVINICKWICVDRGLSLGQHCDILQLSWWEFSYAFIVVNSCWSHLFICLFMIYFWSDVASLMV